MNLRQQEIEELPAKVGNPYRQILYNSAQDLIFGLSPEDGAAVLARAKEYRAADLECRKLALPEAAVLSFGKPEPANSAGGSS